ncbi:MAG: glycyl-radical enzyme activating protein [Sedimentisphaerales bacterium]|nr:glycyl-radical enzyme activating protein [Sedimentisphaerales bacterium]
MENKRIHDLEEIKGFVFDIQHYAIHDGPGIRTTVFLSGCPLKCLWCQNPESQELYPQLFFSYDKCTGCGKCISVCTQNAISQNGSVVQTDRNLCKICGKCVTICPNEARTIIGKEITAGEVLNEVSSDKMFYQESNGGVTLSGGEVLVQHEFSCAILELCKNENIHTAIETSGYGSWETLKNVLTFTDLVLFDFKHFDDSEHIKFTGVSNETILENAKKIYHELKIPIVARLPIIPDCNDSIMNIKQTANFISTMLDKLIKVHLLPYNNLGEQKHKNLEQSWNGFSGTIPSDKKMNEITKILESYGLSVKIGG